MKANFEDIKNTFDMLIQRNHVGTKYSYMYLAILLTILVQHLFQHIQTCFFIEKYLDFFYA